jgi:hypothetical protein
MNPTGQIITYRKKRLFGLIVSNLLAIRYDRDNFIVLDNDGKPYKEKASTLQDSIETSYTVRSGMFKLMQGRRFLEKAIFNSETWDKDKFLRAYLNIVGE